MRAGLRPLSAYLLAAASALCAQTSASAQQLFTISGTVVEHRNGRPLGNVMVAISPIEHRDHAAFCMTQSEGRFVFTDLAAGKYTLTATRRGFEPQLFQQNEGYSTGIAVGPGLDSEHIMFPLSAAGSLSGTVIDEEGDPVRQAQVWLFRKRISFGRSGISSAEMQNTGSSGEFHFAHLMPGTYFVGVQARPWYAQNALTQLPATENQHDAAASELDVAYPVTYYSDTLDPASASPIAVTEGSTASIQIALRPVRALRVELTGFDAKPNEGVSAWASQPGPGGVPITAGGGVITTYDNRHFVTGLPPGRCVLQIQKYNHGQVESSGEKAVDLNEDSTLDVQSLSKATLSGNVTAEDGELPAGLTVFFARSVGSGPAAEANVSKNGSFSAKDGMLPAGKYQVILENAPGFYLKSLVAKGAKFSAGELKIPEGVSVQLSVVIAKGLTRIEGIALKDNKPCAGAMVLLIPTDLNRMDFVRRDQSDSDGTFTLSDVPPGQYSVLAIDDGRDLAYEEPSIIGPYLSQGQRVTIPLPSSSPIKIQTIPRRK